ncbi:hypothetical protein ABB37_09096 [Leptomonas pyrrhocoris]|uniref:Uncharacterized protein n=1 Tax=Leptomonas pyrrhocoris TaxID=157538 RepID=A0A0M9FR62_LEPPY|nr:hypothetical protein ABB37_09096 [Leptomonas pyrrhocoris]KPA74390.1 hypothetical protein ABB37_09096 [Leptomonas pyrrhocoris]|eukprot:XP_015652829.1 hypothetical protein ABB37_09096 [Leptomonas pyrrhocoris]
MRREFKGEREKYEKTKRGRAFKEKRSSNARKHGRERKCYCDRANQRRENTYIYIYIYIYIVVSGTAAGLAAEVHPAGHRRRHLERQSRYRGCAGDAAVPALAGQGGPLPVQQRLPLPCAAAAVLRREGHRRGAGEGVLQQRLRGRAASPAAPWHGGRTWRGAAGARQRVCDRGAGPARRAAARAGSGLHHVRRGAARRGEGRRLRCRAARRCVACAMPARSAEASGGVRREHVPRDAGRHGQRGEDLPDGPQPRGGGCWAR